MTRQQLYLLHSIIFSIISSTKAKDIFLRYMELSNSLVFRHKGSHRYDEF